MSDSISVIIPVYNAERYLAEAIESVLAQTHPPQEVIVVDDGSTDATASVAQAFAPRVRYVFQPNVGANVARNRGVELSTGSLLAFLDADDLWLPEKLAKQLAVLADPAVEAVLGHIRQFYSPETSQNAHSSVRYAKEIMPGFHLDTLLVRRSAFMRVGFFDPDCRVGQTIDWFARAQEAAVRQQMLPEVVALRRIHDTNITIRQRAAVQSSYFRVLKAALDRRRWTAQND